MTARLSSPKSGGAPKQIAATTPAAVAADPPADETVPAPPADETVPAPPADETVPAPPAVTPHRWSVGKTRRMIAASRCPGGVGVLDPETGACASCPAADACTVARFHPEG